MLDHLWNTFDPTIVPGDPAVLVKGDSISLGINGILYRNATSNIGAPRRSIATIIPGLGVPGDRLRKPQASGEVYEQQTSSRKKRGSDSGQHIHLVCSTSHIFLLFGTSVWVLVMTHDLVAHQRLPTAPSQPNLGESSPRT